MDTLRFTGPVELTAASPAAPTRLAIEAAAVVEFKAAADATKRPTFDILGYTGAVLNVAGFYSPVIVDLAGFKAASQTIPALRDHDTGRIVGQTDSVKVDAKGVRLAGTVTGDNPDAREVVSQSTNGFKWKASIGADVVRREFLDPGKKATVNGREVVGPVLIAREALLQEISFVAIGADGNTSVNVAAKKGPTMPDAVLTDDQAADPVQAERTRTKEIRSVFAGKFREIEARCIDEGHSVQEAKAACLDAIRARRTGAGFSAPRGGNGFILQAIEAGLMIRAGREALAVKLYGPEVAEQGRAFRSSSMLDICGHLARTEGRDTAGMSKTEVIRAAFSTSSLPVTLSNVMGKSLVAAYMESTESWRGFALVKPAANFQPQVGIRPSFVGQLEKLAPTGEVKHGQLAESTYPWQISTYARMFSIDRQDLINDNIGFIDETPTLMGKAAARSLNDLVWTTILGAQTANFYSTGNKNLLTAALSSAALQAAISAMRTQRDTNNDDVQIKPAVLAVPPELEFTALSLVHSALVGRTDAQPSGNPLENVVQVVAESRLSNATKFGAAANANDYYLFSGPMDAPVIVGFLDGRDAPTVETWGIESRPEVMALSFRIFHDFGCALGDFRATNKNHV